MTRERMGEHRGAARLRSWRRWLNNLSLAAEAVVALVFARVLLHRRPFRQVAMQLTRGVASAPDVQPDAVGRRVRWAVLAAARRLPWRALCFDQAIAAQRMLARRGVAADVVYGVRRSGQPVDSHVWVRLADGWIVVGGEQAVSYEPIAVFRPGHAEALAPEAPARD